MSLLLVIGLGGYFAGMFIGYAYAVAGKGGKSRMSKTSDTDPRIKSGGNDPLEMPATMSKGENITDE